MESALVAALIMAMLMLIIGVAILSCWLLLKYKTAERFSNLCIVSLVGGNIAGMANLIIVMSLRNPNWTILWWASFMAIGFGVALGSLMALTAQTISPQ